MSLSRLFLYDYLMFVKHLQITATRIACDLKLYNILAEGTEPLTVAELAQKTGATHSFLARLLRYLAAQNDIKEVGKDMFTANHITKTLAQPGAIGGIYLFFDVMGLSWQALPDWLKEHNYVDVTDPDDTPHQKGHRTSLRTFDWAATHPEIYAHSHQYMKVQFDGLPSWLDVYPYQRLAESLDPNQIFFIDLEGGIGHQAVALREKVPQLPNRVIVQDTPDTVTQVIKHPGVEAIAQDLFQPQAHKGAKIYYLRNIIHDHSDARSAVILQHTKAALSPGSVILIDDMVIPNVGAHWHAMSLDLAMMSSNAALERTMEQWESLVDMAGLKITNVYPYTSVLRNSIIECVSK